MPPSALAPPARTDPRNGPGHGRSGAGLRLLIIAGVIIFVLALVAGAWPFSRNRVLQNLSEAANSQLQVRAFHRTYFPHPGCVIEGLTFRHRPNESKPLIAIQKLTIEGSYAGLISKRVSRMIAEGMVVSIPAFGSGETFETSPSKITIGEIVANGAVVEFASRKTGTPPLRFDVHEASLRNVGWSGPLTYRIKVRNPNPPAEVIATGKFGVWRKGDGGETPISGEYKFEQADLGVYEGIAGKLTSAGQFSGKLRHIDIAGTTEIPDFVVKSGGHMMPLTNRFRAYVDATHGDTFLEQVDSNFLKTHVEAKGSIASAEGKKGKVAKLDFRSNGARIEDLLRLFVEANRAPMSGSVTLQAHVEIPPGSEEFLKKLKLRGSFGILSGIFSPETQHDVNKLSAGARGEKNTDDPETVLTDLAGHVVVEGGTAHFSDLSFGVPGASARLHGTYNLINYKIDLRGQMHVESKISNAESGGKAFLIKMMEPFFKKKKKGEIVPVRISGTYKHPSFGLDVHDKDGQSVPPPRDSGKPAPPSH